MTFVYRCPIMGLNVQGFVADDPRRGDVYEALKCTACSWIHWVNPKTGKLLGEEESRSRRS